MTGEERFVKGQQMEKEKKTVDEIVAELGYKDRQAWYQARCYYKGKDLTRHAGATPEQRNEPDPILKEINCVKVPVKPEAAAEAKAEGLKLSTEIKAEGRTMIYRYADGRLSIKKRNGKYKALVLSIEETRLMISELKDLIGQVGRV